MDINEITIGERLRKDLGDLSGLKASIQEIGLLHPVGVTKEGLLIFGERRLTACKELEWTDIPVTVFDEEYLLQAECSENAIRKDLVPSEQVASADAIEVVERKAAKERQGTRNDVLGVQSTQSTGSGKSRDKVARLVGTNHKRLKQAREVTCAAKANPQFFDLVEKMDKTGNVSGAHSELKRRKKKAELADRLIEMPAGKFRVFYADPPWSYNDKLGGSISESYGAAEKHYPSMSIQDLCAMPITDMADEIAVLFMWTTSPLLFECQPVFKSWGFTYKASFIWDKVSHNMGHYNSVRHEFLLICTRGSCTPDVNKLYDSVQSIERGKHSEKPEAFREIIDHIYPHGKRIELFARKPAEGWEVYGNEC